MSPSSPSALSSAGPTDSGVAEITASCRMPLLTMFVSAAIWLVIGSVFGLIASIKFHSPNFLADCAWLTYGRVRPASNNAMLYGFCVQAGLGVALWMFAWLGRTLLAQRELITVGAKLWNLGVTVGVIGILAGDGTGYENLDMPRYAALILFLGYVMIGVWGALTFHQRVVRPLFVSQWFLLSALFWFPWIYATANLLVIVFPVRGVAQAIIAWWFSNNLQVVWLGLVGLGAAFYYVPKLTNRELHSGYLVLITFWMLILFGTWGGIANSAPVPAWLPSLSTAATLLTIIPILTLAMTIYQTLEGKCSLLMATDSLRLIGFGIVAFMVAGVMNVAGSLVQVSQITDLTWFIAAKVQLNNYGFFAMVMFGAIYLVVPQIVGLEFPSAKLIRAHFWVAAAGVVLIVVPLGIGGIVEGIKLQNPNLPFLDVARMALHFLRISTIGDLLIAVGHIMFAVNLGRLVARFYHARAMSAYAAATADLHALEARS